ncbi:MAG: TRAP transporter small permease, partial [Methylobacterium sp.]
ILQIAEALNYGPRSAGWADPKVGLGSELNPDSLKTSPHP